MRAEYGTWNNYGKKDHRKCQGKTAVFLCYPGKWFNGTLELIRTFVQNTENPDLLAQRPAFSFWFVKHIKGKQYLSEYK